MPEYKIHSVYQVTETSPIIKADNETEAVEKAIALGDWTETNRDWLDYDHEKVTDGRQIILDILADARTIVNIADAGPNYQGELETPEDLNTYELQVRLKSLEDRVRSGEIVIRA